jgi:hypothetical protein
MGEGNIHGSGLNSEDWLALRDVLWPFYLAKDPARVEIIQGLPEHLREHPLIALVHRYRDTGDDKYLDEAGRLLVPTGLPFGWRVPVGERDAVGRREVGPDPYAGHPVRIQGPGIRRWIEMVDVLHRLGYGRLRLACSWEAAGPAPVWFGVVAAGSYFRRDHGAILARHPFPARERAAWEAGLPNAAPMFSSRRCLSRRDHPWPGFQGRSAEAAAIRWAELYPELAAEGVGEDAPYSAWYRRMLEATSPHGLLAASAYWEPPPGYMYVFHGPTGVDRFELPPPGEDPGARPAEEAETIHFLHCRGMSD